MGLEQRELSPGVIAALVMLAGEVRSYQRASVVYQRLCGQAIPAKTIQRLVLQVGNELVQERDAENNSRLEQTIETAPQTAVVQCDGGRIMTRESGCGPGVHEPAWKETKCAGLFRMTHQTFAEDPQPELPPAFCDRKKVAELAEKVAPEQDLSEPEPDQSQTQKTSSDRIRPLHRTVLASMESSHVFGKQIAREAKRRRFDEATNRAFLGDGLPWNWSIQQEHFSEYTPILDFIHVVSYLYKAAVGLNGDSSKAWKLYREMASQCWQGQAATVVNFLATTLTKHGVNPDDGCDDEHELREAFVAWRYLGKNMSRMDYQAYRTAGLPVTSSLMESLVKQINMRTKGTEMFWNRGPGAESILQIRAAVLCDDDRLAKFLSRRPGSPWVRPPKTTQVTAA